MKVITTIASLLLVGFASAQLAPKSTPVAQVSPVVAQVSPEQAKADANVQVKIANKIAAQKAQAALLAPYEARVSDAEHELGIANSLMFAEAAACKASTPDGACYTSANVQKAVDKANNHVIIEMERLNHVKETGVTDEPCKANTIECD